GSSAAKRHFSVGADRAPCCRRRGLNCAEVSIRLAPTAVPLARVLPSRKFDLRVFTVNHHARRVVTNKLKRNHNPLKLARLCRWDLRQSVHARDGIQSFPGRSPWAVLSFGDGAGGVGTPPSRFRTIQVHPKDLRVLPGHPEPAVSWHSGFREGSPCST